jgi:hypothetical protein
MRPGHQSIKNESKTAERFGLIRKILTTLGLSEERVEELIALIEGWLGGDDDVGAGGVTGKTGLSYPYRLQDSFLTPAERDFYRVLVPAVAGWAVVFAKVRLGDLFKTVTPDSKEWYRARNRIERKHVDFVLVDQVSLQPLLGIELNDRSHQRKDRQERDQLVVRTFAAAELPLVGIAVRGSYAQDELERFLREKAGLRTTIAVRPEPAAPSVNTQLSEPACPQCGSPMVLRTARRGGNVGNQFWGCSKYPTCKGTVAV